MDKVILPDGWNFDAPVISRVKVSSRGLVGDDLKSFIKRAGHQFADRVRRMEFAAGDVPIHLLAMGATEFFGANRNGDGFKEAMLQRCHPTFVKHARYYYDHANKNPAKSYGYVKESAYHPVMRRVELLVCLNGTKTAAVRNGGFVAEKDLADLDASRDIPVSMAIRVPFDQCSGCGNKARTRDEYCTEATCKYGGLKEHITKVAADGHMLHADNPDGVFFDISRVFRPADRIAYVFGRIKAAAAGDGIGGAALAEMLGVTSPWNLPGDDNGRLAKLAALLAGIEREVEAGAHAGWKLAFAPVVQGKTTWHDHGALHLQEVLAALAAEKVAMPLDGFLRLSATLEPSAAVLAAVTARLPGVYGRMTVDGSLTKCATNPFAPSRSLPSLAVRQWAHERVTDYSLDERHADRRVKLAAVRNRQPVDNSRGVMPQLGEVKAASDAEVLARAYAMYKLGLLQSLEDDPAFPLTARLVVHQNYA